MPLWADCSGLSPELRCWRLQVGNLSIDMDGRLWRRRAPPSGASQLVVPHDECRDMICRFHDSLFAGHLGVSRTVFRLQSTICLERKSPWWIVSPDGRRPVHCRTRPRCPWWTLSSSMLCVASECLVLFIRIKAGNSRIKSCRNCVFFAVHIKPGLRHIIRRVMAWWNVLIELC